MAHCDYLGIDIPQNIIDQGQVAIETYLETWTQDRNNWPKDESVSVVPNYDGVDNNTILFGVHHMTDEEWEAL